MTWSNNAFTQNEGFDFQKDSASAGYLTQKQMFDTIQSWIFTKSIPAKFGLLDEQLFKHFVKLTDSIASDKTIYGQFVQYRWQVERSFKKAQKRAKKEYMKLENVEFYWNKKIEYKNEGIYSIKRVEVPFMFKKKKYNLRFESLLWNQYLYHVGKIQIIEDE